MRTQALTVTEYATRLGRALRQVGAAVIEGEIQKVITTQRGMVFFDLTDGESLLSCKVFPREARRLEHRPSPGDLVQVRVERPDLYAERGALNLIVSQIRLAGEGELLRRRQELIDRFTAEGFCDPTRRRPLPRFPRAVGVIAGKGSDGMSDVIRALSDRWPAVHVITCTSVVQGKTAPRQLIDGLARLQDHPLVDVIVIARGGGSVADLACFDDEGLCKAIFACEVPVVCAIGHTDNNPVCNHVAWPAFTPSRSAELVVPSITDLLREVAATRERLDAVPGRVELASERVQVVAERLDVEAALDARGDRVGEGARELVAALGQCLNRNDAGLVRARGTLTVVPHRAARGVADERERLASAARALADCERMLSRVANDVRQLGERVRACTHRQLDDHTRDYGRALARLQREARSGIDRREARARELVEREVGLLAERVRRRLDTAHRAAASVAAVIAASDFRRRGWLLAAAADGTPVHSVVDVRPGQRLELDLHDGRASAIVDDIQRKTGVLPHERHDRAHLRGRL